MIDIHSLGFGKIAFRVYTVAKTCITECKHVQTMDAVCLIEAAIPNLKVTKADSKIVHHHFLMQMLFTIVYEAVKIRTRLILIAESTECQTGIKDFIGFSSIVIHSRSRFGRSECRLLKASAGIVFLPNIMILYLFISFMEDSGYLARAAFIMDRVMHRIGLHGKSFIPLIMGFGCNVPAIMACRTIESRSSRLITILITPFMSCSARIPIYLLLAGTFFAADASLVMIGLYVLGVVLAVVTARLMRRFMFPVDETPFVMELPPYRLPTWKTTLTHMWDKCAQYLRKMGGMILIASMVVWFLSYYPRSEEGGTTAHYENSYLGRLGQRCAPIFSPLGLNWKAGVALLSGVPAKEIVVRTLGVLYPDGGEAASAPGAGTTEIVTG